MINLHNIITFICLLCGFYKALTLAEATMWGTFPNNRTPRHCWGPASCEQYDPIGAIGGNTAPWGANYIWNC